MAQTDNGNQGESGGSRSRTYSAAEFQTLARKRVEEALGHKAIPGTEMNGVLGPFSDGKAYSSAIYEIKLLDLDPAETSYVELVIPRKNSPGGSPGARSLEEQVRFLQNRPVKVRGDVQTNTFNGRISFRLWVRQITDLDSDGHETYEAHQNREQSMLSVLSEYRRFGDNLPRRASGRDPFKVCLIHPASGHVHEDFSKTLSKVRPGLVDIERKPVSFHNPGGIAQTISEANADIVALLRGGGDATEFRALNDPELIGHWMKADAYTVSGLGHAGDATLLDLVSDKSCTTPTAAGEHVRDAIYRSIQSSSKQQSQTSPPAESSQPDGLKKWKAWAVAWAVLFFIAVAVIAAFINNLPPGAFEQALNSMFR